jgi:hypothetical protein
MENLWLAPPPSVLATLLAVVLGSGRRTGGHLVTGRKNEKYGF